MISPEIASWYRSLQPCDQMLTDRMIARLTQHGNRLRMPHSRALGNGLFELRFAIQQNTVEQRITYIFDAGRRIITLTTFRKTRDNETDQIARARDMQATFKKETAE